MSTVPGAVPTALVAAMNKPGGGDKPFTYCPGGVDFSELRSPKMSKRLAKNNQKLHRVRTTQYQAYRCS